MKSNLQREGYLKFKSRLARVTIARLRSGSNFLRIETGRHDGEELEDRVCRWCRKVEDEAHFLLECDLYRDIRAQSFPSLNLSDRARGNEALKRIMGATGGTWDRKP